MALVSSALLAHTTDLELVIRHVLAGLGQGVHAGRERGAGVEFSEYRAYAPGDEWRRVDIEWQNGPKGYEGHFTFAELKREGVSMVVSEQALNTIRRCADRVYVIDRGVTVWSGTVEGFYADPEITRKYLMVQ